jgi:hypothetical protein
MSAVTAEGMVKRVKLDCNQAGCCTFPKGLRLEGDEETITKLLECVCPE